MKEIDSGSWADQNELPLTNGEKSSIFIVLLIILSFLIVLIKEIFN